MYRWLICGRAASVRKRPGYERPLSTKSNGSSRSVYAGCITDRLRFTSPVRCRTGFGHLRTLAHAFTQTFERRLCQIADLRAWIMSVASSAVTVLHASPNMTSREYPLSRVSNEHNRPKAERERAK